MHPQSRLFTLLKQVVLWATLTAMPASLPAEPRPGDVFREYNMGTMMLRIGERHEWGGTNWGKRFTLAPSFDDGVEPYAVDLEGAVRAEVVIGYDQCHGGTTGLSVAFNGHDYLRLPLPATIPEPVAGHMFWPFPTIPLPLSHLREGTNSFQLKIDAQPRPEGDGGWFQNLVYAVVLRVYYSPEKEHPRAALSGVTTGDAIGRSVTLGIEAPSGLEGIERVEYIGQYLDFDHDGDGIFREWQYRYQGHEPAGLYGHVGTATEAPFTLTWDTSWIPDQQEHMFLAARVVGRDGLIYMTEEVRNLRLERPGYSVEMCIPHNVDVGWVTRKGRMGQNFTVRGNLDLATLGMVRFRSWGGNDEAGGWINDIPFPRFVDGFTFDPNYLDPGRNRLDSAQGGHNGHHGLEVVWPGAVVFIRYEQHPPLEYFTILPPGFDPVAEPSRKLPVFVYLHGSGARRYNIDTIQQDAFYDIIRPQTARGFMVVVPLSKTRWQAAALDELLDLVLAEQPADPERMYLGGHSMGGSGTWNALRYIPQRFAAAVPVAGGYPLDADEAARLPAVPVWAVFGELDNPEAQARTSVAIEAIQAAGGEARFTILPGADHMASRNQFFANPELYEWLLAHKRQP